MATAWENLPGSSGDAWARMCGTSGDAWARLAGTVGDAWQRLIAPCGEVILRKGLQLMQQFIHRERRLGRWR
jgi:hypothetical protein